MDSYSTTTMAFRVYGVFRVKVLGGYIGLFRPKERWEKKHMEIFGKQHLHIFYSLIFLRADICFENKRGDSEERQEKFKRIQKPQYF